MHIPDAYLSPITQIVGFVVMVPLWKIASRKTAVSLTTRQTPLVSIGAAFAFAVQMFNIPAIGGTTAHALGAGLLAILVGPWAALLGMSLTLAIQAIMFGDGGILSLAVNSFNMGFVACFLSYAVFRLLSRNSTQCSPRFLISSALGAYAGTVGASLSAGLILGVQPLIAHDLLGHPLYCPFGIGVTVPAMVLTHLLVAGPAEAILTVAAIAYITKVFPFLLDIAKRPKIGQSSQLLKRLCYVLALTPLGLFAAGSAFGEWDLGEIKEMIGYVPQGMSRSHEFLRPLLPDYKISGLSGRPWEIAAYLLSAFVGCTLILFVSWALIGRRPRPATFAGEPRGTIGTELPAWMREETCALLPSKASTSKRKGRRDLIADIIKNAKSTFEETFVCEEIAKRKGFAQSLSPGAKAAGLLASLVLVGFSQNALIPSLIFAAAVGLAALSQVPLKKFISRTLGSVLFFGVTLGAPLALKAVTPGPIAFACGPVVISTTGLLAATLLLTRLAASISTALLVVLTTRPQALVAALKASRVPGRLVTSLALTYRYLFVLLETVSEMANARCARQVGEASKSQVRTYAGNGAAILFAKSLALTEEVHQAMLARGITLSSSNSQLPGERAVTGVVDAI